MEKERLQELLDNVLAWGSEHDKDFRTSLIDAMDISEEEYEELFDSSLTEYIDGEEDDALTPEIREKIETDYNLDLGETDGMNLREIENLVGEEEGALDRYLFEDEDSDEAEEV